MTMTVKQAREIAREFAQRDPQEEDEILRYTEALSFLIEEEKDPGTMMELGGYYYGQQSYDLALKYYEMAAAMEYPPAYECLGYVWYYGRTGVYDYKKAFEYFSQNMVNSVVSAYKVADMYRNGYYVEKNPEVYREIIENCYKRVQGCKYVSDPVPEVYTRLAKLRAEEGETEEAIDLYLRAKSWLAQRIHYSDFFGNLNIMKWLIDDLYGLMEFDDEYFNLFDLYHVLRTPHQVRFYCNEEVHFVESAEEDAAECSVCFDGTWYQTRDEFFMRAMIGGERLTAMSDELYGFEILNTEVLE